MNVVCKSRHNSTMAFFIFYYFILYIFFMTFYNSVLNLSPESLLFFIIRETVHHSFFETISIQCHIKTVQLISGHSKKCDEEEVVHPSHKRGHKRGLLYFLWEMLPGIFFTTGHGFIHLKDQRWRKGVM